MPEWSKLALLPMEKTICQSCGNWFTYFRLNQHRKYCITCRRDRIRAQSLRAKHKQRAAQRAARKATNDARD